ncbi:Echinoderm microtubule-associated protein-like 1 [Lamellibrachia satsuma]|nr:Echinoderm microtubule-associated protein-like 1 [Lamellibrachia satsuma]
MSKQHSSSLSSLPQSSARSPFLRQGNREPSFCQDDGSLRFYLRGRPINLYAPTNLTDYDVSRIGQAPDQHLKLEWVYGYRGRDARCNLYQLPTGEMVYFIASTVILYNVEEQMQRHYLGHTDDVKCIAVHPDKITIATGQVAGHDKREGKKAKDLSLQHWPASVARRYADRRSQPHIRIWDSVSLNTLKVIGIGEFDRAVACIGFSKSDGGLNLVAIDDGNEHTISVWEWQKGERGYKITETKSSTEPVLAAEFHPCENTSIVTCGKNQISFWTLEGGTLTRKLGLYEKHDKPKFVTCLAFAENGDVLTGDSNGSLFVWGRATNRVLDALVAAHEGTIFSICVLKDGTLLTGGKDRKIIHWGAGYKKMGLDQEISEQYGAPRMLSQGKGNMILVGTTRNRILQGALGLEFSPIVQGHMDELWGLTVHPSQHQFVTCGYDSNLYVWDTLTHSAIWCMEMTEGCHCIAFHPEGNIIAVGCLSAKWLVIDIITRDTISTHVDGIERAECIAYSPDGQSLALGSRDNNIYLYSVSDGGRKYSRRGRCSGHSSFLTHIDWSVDSQFLQSTSGDYELLFWNASTCHQLTSPSSMRDTQWVSQSCTLGFNVCGVWPEGADGTDVNACCRSNQQNLVASADDFGKVNLYSYPACQPRSQSHTYSGHSSHVTNVSFLCDDTRLLSTGGKDMAVLQWQIL